MNINVDKKTQTGKSRTINASSYSGQMKQVCVRMLEESDQLMIKPSCVKHGRAPSSWKRLSRVSQ